MTHIYLRRQINPRVRDDQWLTLRANNAIRNSGYSQLGRVRAECRDGQITLTGVVSSYFMKSLAQETVFAVPGTKGITNDIVVKKAQLV